MTTDTATMFIGELADAVGVNAKTIRYYEEIGLLPAPGRTAAGYRVYTASDVDRLRFVRRAQQLDLRLDEIGEILAMRDGGDVPCQYVREVAAVRLVDLDRRISEMQEARRELAEMLSHADELDGAPAEFCALIEHNAPDPA